MQTIFAYWFAVVDLNFPQNLEESVIENIM